MKISVCASITYYYNVEVPDNLCELDTEGYLEHEAELLYTAEKADPLTDLPSLDDCTWDINSIVNAETGKELYILW